MNTALLGMGTAWAQHGLVMACVNFLNPHTPVLPMNEQQFTTAAITAL
jgi:hypothetical protein